MLFMQFMDFPLPAPSCLKSMLLIINEKKTLVCHRSTMSLNQRFFSSYKHLYVQRFRRPGYIAEQKNNTYLGQD